MDWKTQAVILFAELSCGFLFGRFLIPLFRRIKTGRFEFYIGDRFKKDGSEPRFGGGVMFLTLLIGLTSGAAGIRAANGNFYAEPDLRLLMCAVFFCGILTSVGLYEDYQRDTKSGIGMKKLYKLTAEFVVCTAFLLLIKAFGFECREVLLPFRLGYLNLGWGYVPLTALLMVLIINIIRFHDCSDGVTETGIDGLCPLSVMISALGLASGLSYGDGHISGQLFAVCTAGVCGGIIFWCISPSKLYIGQSGSILLGGLVCMTMIFSGLHIAVLLTLAAPIIDGVCGLVQRLVFRLTKRLIFKGASLHGHLKSKGWGDYKIMLVSALVQLAGCGGAVAFIVYESKLHLG